MVLNNFLKCARSEAEPGDGIDNDCDGTADEEDQDQKDNDNDGDIDEDTKLVDQVAVIDFFYNSQSGHKLVVKARTPFPSSVL